MKRCVNHALAIAGILFATAAPAATPLDIQPGAWNMTATTVTQGQLIPQSVLADMPPAQRAKVEASMKARAGKPDTHTYQECVTRKDIEQAQLLDSDEANCTQKILSQSARHVELSRSCAPPDASQGRVVIDTPNPKQIRMNIDITRQGGNVRVDVNGHWTGACTGKEKG